MQHHKIKVEKTAHYYTHGQLAEQTKYLWFVTHGYGQLASHIIRKFEGFDADEHMVVAPEALNRFYWNMRDNIVGANWMTKQDRLDDIADYSAYLSTVFNQFAAHISPNTRVILLGFSQGCATQIRWILRGMPAFHQLIMWGGILPEDIDYKPFTHYFSDKKLHFVCGDNDEFINQERIDWHIEFANAQGLDVIYHPFVGKHEILTAKLQSIFEEHIKI
jgi:predicted esterase